MDEKLENSTETVETEKESKLNWWEIIGMALIFAYNSFVIFHNFAVKDGYGWAIFGIIVNLALLVIIPGAVLSMKGKKAGIIALSVTVILFIVGGIIGCSTASPKIEESAVSLVNQIIEENYGSNGAECTKVKILKEISKNFYYALATLDNGNDLRIYIEYMPESNYIEVRLAE